MLVAFEGDQLKCDENAKLHLNKLFVVTKSVSSFLQFTSNQVWYILYINSGMVIPFFFKIRVLLASFFVKYKNGKKLQEFRF